MTTIHRLGTLAFVALAAALSGACSSADGGAEPAAAQTASDLTTKPAPIYGTGPNTGCTSVIECLADSGFPQLIVSCPGGATFSGPGAGSYYGTSEQVTMNNAIPTFPIKVCTSGGSTGQLFVCDSFSTYWSDATYCGTSSGGGNTGSCGGEAHPKGKCSEGWRCCGVDGWSCGVCY